MLTKLEVLQKQKSVVIAQQEAMKLQAELTQDALAKRLATIQASIDKLEA